MNPSDPSAERHLIVTVQSQPEHRQRVQELLLELVDPVRSEPGCLYYTIYQQADDANAFMIVAGWANDEAVAAHPSHPSVPGVLDRMMPLLVSPNPMTIIHTRRLSKNVS